MLQFGSSFVLLLLDFSPLHARFEERGGHFNKSALEEAADNGGYWTAKFLMA